MKCRHIKFFNIKDAIFASGLPFHADGFCVSVTGETAGICDERCDTLIFFHLINHRALHFACYGHKAVVWTYADDVTIGETYVACHLSV